MKRQKKGHSSFTKLKQKDLASFLPVYIKVTQSPNLGWLRPVAIIDCFAGDGRPDPVTLSDSSPSIILGSLLRAKLNQPPIYGLIEKDGRRFDQLVLSHYRWTPYLRHGSWEHQLPSLVDEMIADHGVSGGILYLDPNGPFDGARLCEIMNSRKMRKWDCLINVGAAGVKRAKRNSIVDAVCGTSRKHVFLSESCGQFQWTRIFISDWRPSGCLLGWHESKSPEGLRIYQRITMTESERKQINSIEIPQDDQLGLSFYE